MGHFQENSRKRKSKARERIEKRKQRRETLTNLTSESLDILPDVDLKRSTGAVSAAWNMVQDSIWHLRKDAPIGLIAKGVGGFVLVIAAFFLLTTIFSRDIGPNISTMDIKLSGQSVEEATERLFLYWNEEATIDILVEDGVYETVRPSDIGLSLDATATAELAKEAGLSGFFFGKEIEPIVSADYGDIQAYILSINNQIYIPSREAGYAWQDGQLISVPGTPSREIDPNASIQRIFDNPLSIVLDGQVEVVTTSTPPSVVEADPYFPQALAFVMSDFQIEGYDPFRDETERWATTRQEMAEWLVVTENGLSIREDSMDDFLNVVNSRLDVENWSRYLDPSEIEESVSDALLNGESIADVRIRYADSTYSLQNGDWGLRLSRRLGLPFFNIQSVNPGTDWDRLVAGQNIAVPSRDLVIPLEPIENRRIVVDLASRYLVAFENDEIVYDWPISIGRTDAPTFPGVYQILSKVDIAYGSSFSLCNENSECGQWEMDDFMGIYEVSDGLTNGFHGTVRLPNGGTLTRGSTQSATTFGCVMSDDIQAEILYEWAETGIVVELIDSDFPPESDLGRRAQEFIQNRT